MVGYLSAEAQLGLSRTQCFENFRSLKPIGYCHSPLKVRDSNAVTKTSHDLGVMPRQRRVAACQSDEG